MGFMGNKINLCLFMAGLEPDTPDGEGARADYFLQRLKGSAFHDISETADEKSAGWVNMFDNSDVSFENKIDSMAHLDGFLCFSLRQDKRRVPTGLLHEQLAAKCAEWLEQNPGFTRVPKQKREEIRDAVRVGLLAKALPSQTVHDVVWDLSTNLIRFCNISNSGLELFDHLFRKTFPGMSLKLVTPYVRALAVIPDPERVDAMVKANKAGGESILEIIKENTWIGEDFLLWLLHVQAGDGMFTRPEVTAWIDNRLILCGSTEDGSQKVSFSGSQNKLDEIRAALTAGKKFTEARIYMEAGEASWSLTLKGARFDFAGFKCPSVRIEKDNTVDEMMERQAVFFERVELVKKGQDLFDIVFEAFLADRLSPTWGEKLVTIQAWQTSGES